MKRRSVALLIFVILLIGAVVRTTKANKDVKSRCKDRHVGDSTEKTVVSGRMEPTTTTISFEDSTVETTTRAITSCTKKEHTTMVSTNAITAGTTSSRVTGKTSSDSITSSIESTSSSDTTINTSRYITIHLTTPSAQPTTNSTTIARDTSTAGVTTTEEYSEPVPSISRTITGSTTAESTAVTVASTASQTTKETSTTVLTTTNLVTTVREVATNSKVDTTTHSATIIDPCNEFNYVIRDARTKVACILTNMTIRINFRYAMRDSQIETVTLTVPAKAAATGVCGERTAEMTLSWQEPTKYQSKNDDKENKITFYYAHDGSRFFLDSISIDVYLNSNGFPNAQGRRMSGNTTDRSLQLFSASIGREVFLRKAEIKINVGDQMDVIISDISLNAFSACSNNSTITENNHINEANINIGAIAGGIAVAIVLILVISYLIWHKRKKDVMKAKNLLP